MVVPSLTSGGHKHVLSREGGIEIVVKELSTRMAARGHQVLCFDRSSHHVSGGEIETTREYKGVKIVPVWTIERKGLAALTSSISAALKASRSSADTYVESNKRTSSEKQSGISKNGIH